MKYQDLRSFLDILSRRKQLVTIDQPIDPYLEMTEISDRTLRKQGPALLFKQPTGHSIPVLANLFGTPERVALAMGEENTAALREVGKLLAFLKEPDPPKGFREAMKTLPIYKKVLSMSPKQVKNAPC